MCRLANGTARRIGTPFFSCNAAATAVVVFHGKETRLTSDSALRCTDGGSSTCNDTQVCTCELKTAAGLVLYSPASAPAVSRFPRKFPWKIHMRFTTEVAFPGNAISRPNDV